MKMMNEEPISFKAVRIITIFVLMTTSMGILIQITRSPSPVALIILTALFFCPAVGLARKLAWSFWLTTISLLLLAFFWSGSLIQRPEGELNQIQKIIENFSLAVLWTCLVGIWVVALGVVYILQKHRGHLQRKWW